MKDEHELPVILERDLNRLIDRLKLRERIDAGDLECFSCGVPITSDEIGGVIRIDDQIEFLCSSLACMEKYQN